MKYKNPLVKYDDNEKKRMFDAARANNAVAWDENGREYPVRRMHIDTVEYIGGAWRVQKPAPDKIITVRGREFVLGEKLDVREKNQFEYFDANPVFYNCYGPITPSFRSIVGCFVGNKSTFWAYGPDIPTVRSFLAIALYDKYLDMILRAERGERTVHKK